MTRYNDDQQEIDNMSVMNGTFSRVNSDLSSNVSSLRTAISTLSQQVVSLSRSAGSMAKSVAEAGDLKVDKKGFAGRLAGQLGGPLGVVLSNAIIDAGIGERISDSLKNGLAGIMSKFKGRGNYSDGGFLNPASMSSISSRSTGIVIKEIQHGITQPLVTANKIHTDQLLETKSGNRAIISALNSIEDAIDGKDNRVTGKRRSDYGKTHNRSSMATVQSATHTGSVVNNYYSNNSSGSSFDTSSIVEAIGNLNSRFDELADPNSSNLMSGLFNKMPGFLGTAANLAWSIGTFRLTKAFQGKYANDIIRDKNPLITIASAALKQYEWTRLYGELTKEQLNELIRLGGGKQKKIVGRNGWLKDWMLNDPDSFKERKEELEKHGPLGWLASKALGAYQFMGQWDEEQWSNEVYAQAEKLKRTDTVSNPFSGLFGGPFSAWKFYNADSGDKYDTVKSRMDLEEQRRKLYNWNWQDAIRKEKLRKERQEQQSAENSYTQAPENAVPVVIAGAGIVPGWLRALLIKTGLSSRYTRDPISASLALQTKQAGYLDSIQEATEVTKTAAETESRIDGGKTIQEKQLNIWEEISKNYKEDAQYRKDFFTKLGKGILGTGKGTLLGSLGLVGTVGNIAIGLLGFAAKVAGPIAALYGIYKSIDWLAKKFGMNDTDISGVELPNYANQHKATVIGGSSSLLSGGLQVLKSIPGISKIPGLGLANKIIKPVAATAHGIDAYNRISNGQIGRGTVQGINTILDFVPGVGWVASSVNSSGVVAGDYMEQLTGAQQAGDATSRMFTSQVTPAVVRFGTAAVDKGLRYVGGHLLEGGGNALIGSSSIIDKGGKIASGWRAKAADYGISKGTSLVQKGLELSKGTSGYAFKAAKFGGKLVGVGINAALYSAEAAARFANGDNFGGAIAAAGTVIGNIPVYGVLITETALAINDLIKANAALNNTINQNDLFEAQGDTEYLKFGGAYVRSILVDPNIELEDKARKIADHYRKWKKDTAKADSAIRGARAANDKAFIAENKDTIKEITDSIKNDPTISGEHKADRILTTLGQLHNKYQTNKLESAYTSDEIRDLARKAEKDQSFLNQFSKYEQVAEYSGVGLGATGMGYGANYQLVDKWVLDKDSEFGRLKEALANKKITQQEYDKRVALLYKQKELKQIGPTVINAKALEKNEPTWKVNEYSPTISSFGTFQSSTGSLLGSVLNEEVSKKIEQDNLENIAKAQEEEIIKKAKEEEEKARKEYLERLGSASDPIVTSVYTSGDKTTEAIHELTATSERYMKEVQINQQELAKLHTKMYGKGGESVAQAVNDSAKKMSNAVVSSSRYSTQQIVNNSNKTIVAGNQGNDNWFVPMRSTDKSFLTV